MDEVKKAPDQSRGPLILGLILVLVGIAVAIAQFTTIGGSFIVALLGVAFLALRNTLLRHYGPPKKPKVVAAEDHPPAPPPVPLPGP